jgi:hypothetical protein
MISYPFKLCISSEDFAIFLPQRSSSSSFPSTSQASKFVIEEVLPPCLSFGIEEGRDSCWSLCQKCFIPLPLHTISRLLVENIYRVLHILPVRASARHGRNRYNRGDGSMCEDSETEGLFTSTPSPKK